MTQAEIHSFYKHSAENCYYCNLRESKLAAEKAKLKADFTGMILLSVFVITLGMFYYQ